MSLPNGHRRTAGFTLLELLVVMAIAGILLAIVGVTLQSSMRTARSSDFIDALAQDINLARSLAMAKGKKTQIDFVSASAYRVSRLDDAGALVTPPLADRSEASVTLSGFTAGDKLICSPSGFCLAYSAANVLKTINQIDCLANGKTRSLSITVLGLTRTES